MTDQQQAATAFWADHEVTPTWMAKYAQSEGQPHRAEVVKALGQLPRWSSLFEIGCHCGPMLRAVQAAFPGAWLGGCEVNAGVADVARQRGFSVVEGAFPGVTATFPDRCFSVVLSCYALAYISPERLGDALAEAGRLAARAVVLCEPMAFDGVTAYRAGVAFDEWRHPYVHELMRVSLFQGWTAQWRALQYADNYLSGLLLLERPV